MKELIKKTVGDLLDGMAEKYPDHEAVVYTDHNFRKTYSQFRDISQLGGKRAYGNGGKKRRPCSRVGNKLS